MFLLLIELLAKFHLVQTLNRKHPDNISISAHVATMGTMGRGGEVVMLDCSHSLTASSCFLNLVL